MPRRPCNEVILRVPNPFHVMQDAFSVRNVDKFRRVEDGTTIVEVMMYVYSQCINTCMYVEVKWLYAHFLDNVHIYLVNWTNCMCLYYLRYSYT